MGFKGVKDTFFDDAIIDFNDDMFKNVEDILGESFPDDTLHQIDGKDSSFIDDCPIDFKSNFKQLFKAQFEQSTADTIFIHVLLPIEVFVGIAL